MKVPEFALADDGQAPAYPGAAGMFGANILLGALGVDDQAWLGNHLERVPLNEGHIIIEQDQPITFVCFPERGVTSVADVLPDGTRVQIGIIGHDGMTNSQVLLGCERSPHEAVVQIGGGTSLKLDAGRLRELCDRSPAAQALFLRFVHALAVQTARTLTSNFRDSMERRLSRWLLMCHDRIDGDEINLTHDHIGKALGVRRATVTDTLHILEGLHSLKSQRGRIVIRDRAALERLAGDAYGYAERNYCRAIAPFGKGLGESERPDYA